MTTQPKETVRFLIVEDIDEMREMLSMMIDAIPGFKVTSKAASCAEARVKLMRERPTVVLLDEILPGESTGDFLQEMVQDGLPVILMTGVQDAQHPVLEGALGRIAKPGWDTHRADSRRLEQELQRLLRSVS